MAADLFARLVESSGLSSIFAEQTLGRALIKSGVDRRRMTPQDLRRALPDVERALATYLDGDELVKRMKTIRLICGGE